MSDIRILPQIQALAFHSLADLFPLMEGAEFDELVADIKANGLREPIVVYENQILDGRNRTRACEAAGVERTCTVYSGDDPLAYVISANLRRRHLNESQRALIAARLATFSHGGDRSKSPIGDLTQAEAAELLNIGKRSVERAKIVRDQGGPELIKAVEAGEVSVYAVVDSIQPRSPRPKSARSPGSKPSREREQHRFEATLSCIRESCESTVDMVLPRALTREGAAEAINSLSKSAEQISNLLQRLRAQRRLLEPRAA